ncbi:unnamed protein product [Hapterophycus canaliculatus]
MHPLVRNLCRRFVLAARRHPSGEAWFKDQVKEALRNNALLSSEEEIRRAVARGRRVVRDAEKFSRFSRYRAMRRRYSDRSQK